MDQPHAIQTSVGAGGGISQSSRSEYRSVEGSDTENKRVYKLETNEGVATEIKKTSS